MKNSKKILVLVPGWPSNYKPNFMAFFYQQIRSLSKESTHHYEVLVPISLWIFFKIKNIKNLIKKGRFTLHGIKGTNVTITPLFYLPFPKRFLQHQSNDILTNKVCKYIQNRERNYDLIHAHFLECAMVACKAKNKFDIPYVYTEHSSNYKGYFNYYSKSDIELVTKNAKKVIAVSPFLKNEIVSNINIQPCKIIVIPNGVDTTKFTIKRERNDNKVNFLFIGHLNRRKGIKKLLKAFELANKSSKKLNLTVIGDGPLDQWCHNFVKENSLTGKINLLGVFKNDEIPKIIRNHDVLVLPSKSESFGVVVIEAASCGLPAIVTECGGPEYIINSKDLGVVLKLPLTVQSLLEALKKISENLDRFDRERISKKIKDRFDWAIIAKKIASTY